MKLIRLIKLETQDPNWLTRLTEAFNRVDNFCDELRSMGSPESKAYNRVLCNAEFSLEDWRTVKVYGEIVANRAVAAGKNHSAGVLASINQAALNLRDVLTDFDSWIRENSL